MAHILYGLSGQGSGHSSRAKVVIDHLLKKGHHVTIVSYDKGVQNLRPHFPVEEIFGLRFSYQDNEVHYLKTVIQNLFGVPEAVESIQKIQKLIKKNNIDFIITDFEPFTAYVGNLQKIPVISLDNQHRLTKAKVDYPKKYEKDAIAARWVTKLLIPKAVAYLAVTFFPTVPLDKKTFFFPPLLRESILKIQPTEGDAILAYFTSEFTQIIPVLKSINQKFICYGLGKEGRDGNILYKKPSEKEFLKDLATCRGVIANAGFTLVTEALHLGKPYLALPVKGQFEQVLNAHYIEHLGYGRHYDELSRDAIEAFLFNINTFQKNLKKYKKEGNGKILKKLDELITQYTK